MNCLRWLLVGCGLVSCLCAPATAGPALGVEAQPQRVDPVRAQPNHLAIGGTGDKASIEVRAQGRPVAPVAETTGSVVQRRAGNALHFESNLGQAKGEARFFVRGEGFDAFFHPGYVELQPRLPAATSRVGSKVARGQDERILLQFDGANAVVPGGTGPLPGRSHYYRGDRSQWVTDVPHFRDVTYPLLYPGISAVFYGNQQALEYDLLVAPGADPGDIKLNFAHADDMVRQPDGAFVVQHGLHEWRLHAPIAFQEADGRRVEIHSRYVRLAGLGLGIEVGHYDVTLPLVIDPILSYSSYLGGDGQDEGFGIAIGPAGDVYLAGRTHSGDFPVVNPVQGALGQGDNPSSLPSDDAFVTRMDRGGTQLIYSTWLGGEEDDTAFGIAVDPAGNAYVTGKTASPDFPVTAGAFQTAYQGRDAFVAKLAPDGSLVYATYLGGSSMNGGGGTDEGQAIDVDAAGHVYVAGETTSVNFPVTAAFQTELAGGADAFVTKLTPDGSALVYSTFVGGVGNDIAYGITVDGQGQAHIAGEAVVPSTLATSDYPVTVGAYDTACGTDDLCNFYNDAFVTKLSSSGTELLYSTFIGGSDIDSIHGIALDVMGNTYITGQTKSADFPEVNPVPGVAGEEVETFGDAFVAKLNQTGSALLYSSRIGSVLQDYGLGIAVDLAGRAHVIGFTAGDFPTLDSLQESLGGAFVLKLSSAGDALIYATMLGSGGENEAGAAIALDAAGNAHITGHTSFAPFPTINALMSASGGHIDGYVAKLVDEHDLLATRVGNISSRGQVGIADNVLIGGVIVRGVEPTTILVRARGPGLADFGVPGVLEDPALQLFAGQDLIASNDDWQSDVRAFEIPSALAPTSDAEAAILIGVNPGLYTAVVRGVGETTGIGIVEVFEIDSTGQTRLINISTRGFIGAGAELLIGGIILTGDKPVTVTIRARGPSLADFGVPGVLADPQLTLFDASGDVIDSNDNWQEHSAVANLREDMRPSVSTESAITRSLEPGAYTVHVSGVGGATGVGIVELFAID